MLKKKEGYKNHMLICFELITPPLDNLDVCMIDALCRWSKKALKSTLLEGEEITETLFIEGAFWSFVLLST